MSRKSLLKYTLLSLLLFVLALIPRIRHIGDDEPQPDEIHWERRSYGVVERYRQGELSNLTTHLNHPGIPAAFVMGLGEVVGEKINLKMQRERGDKDYIDRLKSSRMANAYVSSLIVPVLFLALVPLVGSGIAIVSASLFAFDPLHIGLSRMAHIDSLLTLLVSLCFFTFVYAVKRDSKKLYFLSAFFWSLCILTKPTAASLLAGLFVYRILRKIFSKEKIPLISFFDYWLVYFALAFFTFSYTRLWFHHDRAKYRLDRSGVDLKNKFHHCSQWLIGNASISYCLIVILLLLSVYFFSKKKVALFHLSAIALSLFLPLFFIPQVIENFVGFWSWVVGLSHEKHVAWGKAWAPPKHGYVQLFFTRTPSLIIASLCAASLFFVSRLKKLTIEEKSLYLAIISCFLFWVIPLNISSKQAYRYMMPVIPFVYILASFGLFYFFQKKLIYCLIPFLIQVYVAVDAFPEPLMYFNEPSGGIRAAKDKGRGLPFSGQNEALKFLQKQAADEGRNYLVGVMGDATTLYYAYRRLFYGDLSRLGFSHITMPVALDYIFINGRFHNLPFDSKIKNVGRMKKVFIHSYKDVDMLDVYEVPIPSYEKPVEFNLISGLPGFAHKQKTASGEYFLEATLGRTRKGHLVHGLNARVLAASYQIEYELSLAQSYSENLNLDPETHVVTLEFGSGCKEVVRLSDLSKERKKITLNCEVDKKSMRQFRVYWSEQVPVALYRMVYVTKAEPTASKALQK